MDVEGVVETVKRVLGEHRVRYLGVSVREHEDYGSILVTVVVDTDDPEKVVKIWNEIGEKIYEKIPEKYHTKITIWLEPRQEAKT